MGFNAAQKWSKGLSLLAFLGCTAFVVNAALGVEKANSQYDNAWSHLDCFTHEKNDTYICNQTAVEVLSYCATACRDVFFDMTPALTIGMGSLGMIATGLFACCGRVSCRDTSPEVHQPLLAAPAPQVPFHAAVINVVPNNNLAARTHDVP